MATTSTKRMKILVAMDGSEHALAGLCLVRDLPLSAESSVAILSVFLPRYASKCPEYEVLVEQARQQLSHLPLQVTTEVLAGIPAEKITSYAEQEQADLIVMGARGLRATLGILLGGVAQQVVEYTHKPVLITRAPYIGLQRVLLAIDGSSYGEHALEYIASFPLPERTQIDLLHVLPPLPVSQPGLQAATMLETWPAAYEQSAMLQYQQKEEIDSMLEKEEQEGKQLLQRSLDKLRTLTSHKPGLQITSQLERGDAATEIIEYAATHGVDLIVTGSRGLSEVKGWLLGSVSRKLLHYVNCSVLVVRA